MHRYAIEVVPLNSLDEDNVYVINVFICMCM